MKRVTLLRGDIFDRVDATAPENVWSARRVDVPVTRRFDDVATVTAGLDQRFNKVPFVFALVRFLWTGSEFGVARDLFAPVRPMEPSSRRLRQVSRLDTLYDITESPLGGVSLVCVIGVPIVKLNEFERTGICPRVLSRRALLDNVRRDDLQPQDLHHRRARQWQIDAGPPPA